MLEHFTRQCVFLLSLVLSIDSSLATYRFFCARAEQGFPRHYLLAPLHCFKGSGFSEASFGMCMSGRTGWGGVTCSTLQSLGASNPLDQSAHPIHLDPILCSDLSYLESGVLDLSDAWAVGPLSAGPLSDTY